MKYLKYVRDEAMNFENVHFLLAIPALPFATGFLLFLFTCAALMDGWRYLRLRHIIFLRKQARLRYVKNVLISLDHQATKENVTMLLVA